MKSPIVEPSKREHCYIQARNFYHAAVRCGRVEENEESGMNQNLVIPECVNIVFSCELFLKVLLYKDDEIIREHNLLKLYKTLDDTIRDKIVNIIGIDESSFIGMLEEYGDFFKDIRYQFDYKRFKEGLTLPLLFFYGLAKALDQFVQETINIKPYSSTSVDLFNLEDEVIL